MKFLFSILLILLIICILLNYKIYSFDNTNYNNVKEHYFDYQMRNYKRIDIKPKKPFRRKNLKLKAGNTDINIKLESDNYIVNKRNNEYNIVNVIKDKIEKKKYVTVNNITYEIKEILRKYNDDFVNMSDGFFM